MNNISKPAIEREILNPNDSKACQESDIIKKIKANSDIFTDVFYSEFNRSTEANDFSPTMKLVNVTPAHKNINHSEKYNYPPVSILLDLSKVFKRCISNQPFLTILSKHQSCFRQGRIAQQNLTASSKSGRRV